MIIRSLDQAYDNTVFGGSVLRPIKEVATKRKPNQPLDKGKRRPVSNTTNYRSS